MMKSAQPILALFATSLVIYALFHVPRGQQTLVGMVIKCLPIVLLQVFVARHGLSSWDNYGHRILAGLIFSSIGDAFLDFPGYFLHGAVAFMIAHFFYIAAFGFSPLKWQLGVGIFGLLSLPSLLVLDALMKLEGISSVVLPIYAIVLKTMVWRSVVKGISPSESDAGTNWVKLATGLGGLFFGLSDTALAIDRFYQPYHYSQQVVMATYYLAQFFLAISVFQKRAAIKRS